MPIIISDVSVDSLFSDKSIGLGNQFNPVDLLFGNSSELLLSDNIWKRSDLGVISSVITSDSLLLNNNITGTGITGTHLYSPIISISNGVIYGNIQSTPITVTRNYLLPDKDGTFAMLSDTQSLPNYSLVATYTQTNSNITAAITATHTHINKALLDTYNQLNSDLTSAVSLKHSHSNKSLLDTYNFTNTDVVTSISEMHTHSNKSLLDSYNQTNTDITTAIADMHIHSNFSLLETYTQTNANITIAVTDAHIHSNLSLLETYNQTNLDITNAVVLAHAHNNFSLLQSYTNTNANITTAIADMHTHSNISVLNNIVGSGSATQFFAQDGNYHSISISSVGTDTQIPYNNSGTETGSSALTFNYSTSTLNTSNISLVGNISLGSSSVVLSNVSGNLTLTDNYNTTTLSTLVTGATNYWLSTTDGIYYTSFVGVNSPSTLDEALTVNGNIEATNFNSKWLQYINSNLLLGPDAGALETGSNLLYIANTNTSTPIIYGDFIGQQLIFNADTYINGVKRLCFGDSTVSIRRDSSNNLTFQDTNANGGSPITLTQLTTLTGYALKSDFISYSSATSITAANLTTWGKASILITGGSSTSFLSADGSYHSVSGGVTPTDNFAKWDSGSSFYRYYSSKTEAGGSSSGGKLYLGTDNPTNTNRLNYDGLLTVSAIVAYSTSSQAGSFTNPSSIALQGTSTSSTAVYGVSATGIGGVFNASSSGIGLQASSITGIGAKFNLSTGNTSDIAKFQLNSVDQVVINPSGVNLITGATYKINGVDILSTKQDTLISATNIKTINGSSLLGSGNIVISGGSGVTPINGILYWDGAAYNPYTSITGTSLQVNNTSSPSTYNVTDYFNVNGSIIGGSSNSSFNGTGVLGNSYGWIGVYGVSNTNYGVKGLSSGYTGVYGTSTSGNGIQGVSSSSNAIYGSSTTGKGLVINNITGNTSNLIDLQLNSVSKFTVDYQGNVNIPTGSTYNINGVPISSGGGVTPIDGILHWDGTAYNPYNVQTIGRFDVSGTTPIDTSTYLNYNGIFNSTIIIGGYSSSASIGVSGTSGSASGIYGSSNTGNGVYGVSASGTGITAQSGTGVSLSISNTTSGLTSSSNLVNIFRYSGTSSNFTGNFINITDNPLTSGTISGSILKATIGTTVRIDMNPRVIDSSSAVAYIKDTHNLLSTSGAKLDSLRNQGIEKYSVDKDGNVNIASGATYQINGVSVISSSTGINSIAYTTSIPFNYQTTDIASHTLVANDVFTVNTTGALDNTTSTVVLTNNTSYTPDLTAFHQIGVYDNTYTYTYLEFFRKRGSYFVSIINVN